MNIHKLRLPSKKGDFLITEKGLPPFSFNGSFFEKMLAGGRHFSVRRKSRQKLFRLTENVYRLKTGPKAAH
jgi:hypothetical protein